MAANTHRLIHNTNGGKEEVTKETIETLTKANLIKNYTVEELKPAKRPSEDLGDGKPAKATAAN